MHTYSVASSNLDLVRSIYAGTERGDFSTSEWADPEIEYVVADGPEPGSVRGLDGLGSGFGVFLSTWDDFRDEAEAYRELDPTRVLVLNKLSGRGKTSRLRIGQNTAQLFEIHDGKVAKIVVWFDRDRAFAELGLAPDTGI